jgi:hypothetical protein
MNILIIETEKYGHNLHLYLRSLIDKFSKKHNIFLLTSNEMFADKNFKILNKKYKFRIFKKQFPKKPSTVNFYSGTLYQISYYFFLKRVFKSLSKKFHFNHVYVNNINHFDKSISIFGSPFKNKYFSVFYTNLNIFLGNEKYSNKRYSSFLYYFLFCKFFKIKELKNIFISNPILNSFLKKKKFLNKIKYIEEFSRLEKNNTKFDIIKKKIKNKKKILVYGRIREDKDIENLLKLYNYDYAKNNVIVIIAGQQEKNISDYIKKKSIKIKNIISINKYIGPKLENYLFEISDFIWIGYKKDFFGSSAVFFQASIANKPIICSNHGLVAWFNRLYKIGLSTNLNNSLKIINFLINSNNIKKIKFKKINHIHNEKNFVNKIYNIIIKNEHD